MKFLIPNTLMLSRLSIMLMPYLVLYRLSKWFSRSQGKLSQLKQYMAPLCAIFKQFLIRHETQAFDLKLSSPLQPGHAFLSLIYARQRRQFIPQGAINAELTVICFVDLFDIISVPLPLLFLKQICAYAKRIIPTTGIANISALITHHREIELPCILSFTPIKAVPRAKSPLTNEIARANNPRLRHPNTSTGDKPTAKKMSGRMAGIIM
jgi:hypothetical protein